MGKVWWIASFACLACTPACAFWELSDWSDGAGSDAGDASDGLPGSAPNLDASPGPDATPFARDTFSRELANGLGSAEIGGTWTLSTNALVYAVQDGGARFTVGAAKSIESYLLDVSALDVDITASFSTSKAPNGNGLASSLVARMATTGEYYVFAVRVTGSTGSVASLKLRDGTELVSANALQISNLPGKIIQMRMQASGSAPTHLRGRAWMGGTAEPSTWDVTIDDSSPRLQAAGAVGLVAYVSGAATNAPVVTTFDDFVALPVAP